MANGGNEMRAADEVTRRMLLPLLAEDPSVLGVVGLDRTVKETERAIGDLGEHGIPVVGTTLTGSGLLQITPMYFQLVPGNGHQAELIDGYAAAVDATRVTVYHPGLDGRDTYVRTLVEEMKSRKRKVFTEVWEESVRSLPKLCADQRDRSRELVYYVGREDDFGDFLTQLTEGCDRSRLPVIVGADAVSRFVVNGESRRNPAFAGLSVSYVGMGGLAVLAGDSCLAGTPAPVASGPGMAWPGERSALGYDVGGLFVEAVRYLDRTAPAEHRAAPHRAAVAQVFRENGFLFEGVTGRIRFSETRIGNLANLAVLKIPGVNEMEGRPVCSYMLEGSLPERSVDGRTHCPLSP